MIGLSGRIPVLANRDFRLLFTGQLLSLVGDEMAPIAITFAILDRGGSAGQVGLVLGCETAAMVLLLLFGGVIADRLPRRLVMLGADVLRCVVQAAVAALLIDGHWHVWELAALAALAGAGAAFFNPALTGLVPELVSGADLSQANALQGLGWAIGEVVGPALAGALVATVGPGSALVIDAAGFGLSALTLARVRAGALARARPQLPAPTAGPVALGRPELPAPVDEAVTGPRGAAGVLADLREGWQGFSSRPWLWSIVGEFSLWHMLVYAPTIVLGAVVAKSRLGGVAAWGAILAAFGVGSLAGGLVALRWRPRHPLRTAMLLSAAFGLTPALLAAGAPAEAIAVTATLGGAGLAVFSALWDTTIQQRVPRELLSRVSSYDWLGSEALLPVGYALAGPAAVLLGLSTTLWLAAALTLVGVAAVLAVPSVRQLRWQESVGGAGPPPPAPERAADQRA